MAGQNQGVSMDQFEAFFRRADLDQDGKISGAEAVGFFQGSNLPKQVLAQIWMHADQSHNGYLSRPEFYNALKLVTVAQSKRELTPDIVKAALYGPASAKIPAPQINLAATPTPQLNSVGAASAPHIGGVPPAASQSSSFRGQLPPNESMNPQYLQSQGMQSTRPPLLTPTATASRPPQGVSPLTFPSGGSSLGPTLPNSSDGWLAGGTVGASSGPAAHMPNRAASPSMLAASPKVQHPISTSSSSAVSDPKALHGPGNGFTTDSMFGGDTFSASRGLPKQPSPPPAYSASSTSVSSAIVPITSAPESSAKPDPFAALQSTYTVSSTGGLPQQAQPVAHNQQNTPQVSQSFLSSGMAVGGGNSSSEQSQPWPKMTRPGIQKYAKVFMEVDTDRDGKISGEQARNLFLSWRLPREVLKQVWDLSDQDNDSMLSLREFCIALYLMERYREGRTLPPQLPSSIMLDEILLSLAGPPAASHGNVGWGQNHGLRPQHSSSGALPIMQAGVRPGMQAVSRADGRSVQFSQQNARGPLVGNSHVNELSNGQQNSLQMKGQIAAETENKVENKEKLLLDSKEKLEFYRTKMQDLVLYKSRCDNRLNEITERALSDKREAELLGKKYEEKYKQVAEIASKLTIEEASFRDIQERKTELHQAIIKMEQGGSADGILQVRADRIQSDLEELLKAITERCKKHGLKVKSTTLVELPPGWQPGIPEIAAVWDEEWDKFEDEGFSFDVAVSANTKPTSPQHENSSPTDSFSPDSMSNADKSERTFTKGVSAFETDSLYTHSEDESKSPRSSPARQAASESPLHDYSDNHFGKIFEADTESHRGYDESAWGTFDNNDDVDSVWGFSAKDSSHEKPAEKYFFGSSDFGGSPSRTESPQADSSFQKNSPFGFEDSVPGTPLSRAGNTPEGINAGAGDPFFDSFSRYDSFSMQDRGSPRRETLTRFDSINSTRSYDHGRGFSFDDSDPFGSNGPFKVSLDSQTPKKGSESWSSF
ncbi:uncharacterized protein [Coffea arabica]|uniref:Uncharacterized protein isoform X1 n=1 Tax=Coffea arabica TaxID=13443 RepID=A0A6P6UQC3_COFAR